MRLLENAGKQVKAAGMQYGYHNHDFEFKLVDKKPLIDLVLSERVPPELMIMQNSIWAGCIWLA